MDKWKKGYYVNTKLKMIIELKSNLTQNYTCGQIYGIRNGEYGYISTITPEQNFSLKDFFDTLPCKEDWKSVPYDKGYGISYKMFDFVEKYTVHNRFGLVGNLTGWVYGFLFPSEVDTYKYSLNYFAPIAAGFHYRRKLQHILYVAFNVKF